MSNEMDDVEALLYPALEEFLELRWASIKKAYTQFSHYKFLQQLGLQQLLYLFILLLISSDPLGAGWAVYILILILPLFVVLLIYVNLENHPLNLVLLGIFTLCVGLAMGLVSAFVDGKIIIEAGVATSAVVISLILYTFWAAKRGHDFTFLGPFLLSLVVIAFTFAIILIFFPTVGKISHMLCSGALAIVFSAYIIFDTLSLIQRQIYGLYIWASVSFYLDIFILFRNLLLTISVMCYCCVEICIRSEEMVLQS